MNSINTLSTTLELKNISAGYRANLVVQDLSLDIAAGELLALLGPSGCGKTTLLKIIAGLLTPTAGEVCFNREVINSLPAERRDVAMVFQKPLLFPHYTVFENVAFGLKLRKRAKAEIAARVDQALAMVQLSGFRSRRPKELSGGQEQRVAIARALVIEPRLMLLDEPFSALDENLRAEMRALVRNLQKRLNLTTVFVTHDQAEAAILADRIALMLNGKLEQVGSPRDFYLAPHTEAAARFFGWRVIGGKQHGEILLTDCGNFKIATTIINKHDNRPIKYVAFRLERARVKLDSGNNGNREVSENCLIGRLEATIDLGVRLRYLIRLANGELIEIEETAIDNLRAGSALKIGDEVMIEIDEDACCYF